MVYVIAGAVILMAVICVVYLRRRPTMRLGEILPSVVMKEKYGLYAENRPTIRLDSSKVPEPLRDLIPMAEKWGIGDDIIRADFEEKATEKDKGEFQNALRGRTADVTAWLDSFDTGPDSPNAMTEEAVCFMYMLEALDESGLWPD
jgi:hypothetical protein